MSDKECDNYYRLITLVVRTGTRTLREVFTKHTSGDIASVLKQHETKIELLNSKRVLTDPQYQLLKANTPDLEKFDISLLVILIQNICTGVAPPDNGWNTAIVLSSDTTVGGYIIRIRIVRNEIVAHSSDTRVSNDLFKRNWAEAENSLKELAAHVDILDEISKEIKNTESMPLTADSYNNLEATLKKWHVEELYTELGQLNTKADEQAGILQTLLNDVASINKKIEGGQNTGNSASANQQTAPVVKFMSIVKEEMNQTKAVLENDYDGVCKLLGINTTQQQQTKALPSIVNLNALTDVDIIKYSKKLGGDWELFAIFLGYKQIQIDQLKATYPQQIQARLRTMIQKWHDVVARCEYENPRNLLAASFVGISDNRTACEVLGDGNRLKDLKKPKPSPETTKKIEDIDFDVPLSKQIVHVFHHSLGPSFEIRTLTDKALEQQQQPGIAGATCKTPAIEEGDQKMDET